MPDCPGSSAYESLSPFTGAVRLAVSAIAIATLALLPQTSRADVTFWVPDLFGSLAL